MDWQAFNDCTKPQFWMLVIPGSIIVLSILFAFDAIKARSRGHYSGWDFLNTLSLVGSVLKWIFKVIGFPIVFIIALFRREAPSFSRRQAEDKTDSSPESDDSEDEDESKEEKPKKRRKIDEYHV